MVVRKNKSDIICFHYGKSGRIKAQCYRLVGFPADFKFAKSKSSIDGIKVPMVQQVTGFDSLSSSNASEHNPQLNLSKDQVQKLMILLTDQNIVSSPSSGVANTSGTPQVYIADMEAKTNTWIVDTRVTIQIVCDSSLLLASKPILKAFVSLPNGYKVQVVAIGTVQSIHMLFFMMFCISQSLPSILYQLVNWFILINFFLSS